MSLKNKQPPFSYAAMLGACLAVVASVPLTAYLGSLFGDTYNMRVAIYGGLLLWVIIGAVSVFAITCKSENQSMGAGRVLLWFVSTWLWPIPVVMWFLMGKRK